MIPKLYTYIIQIQLYLGLKYTHRVAVQIFLMFLSLVLDSESTMNKRIYNNVWFALSSQVFGTKENSVKDFQKYK